MCCDMECKADMCGFEGKITKIPVKREKVPFRSNCIHTLQKPNL